MLKLTMPIFRIGPTRFFGAFALLVAFAAPCQAADDAVNLVPQIAPGQMTRVTVQLEVGGDLKARSHADNSNVDKTLPMSVVANIQYDERRLGAQQNINNPDSARSLRALRLYEKADAVLKVDAGGSHPVLPDDRKRIVVELDPHGATVLASPDGPLQRQHYDLIDVVGDTLVVDRLLPNRAVKTGESWPTDKTTMGALLCLDSVAVSDVQCLLDKFNEHFAQVQLSGTVQGTADGAPTEMRLRGIYLFDRKARRITRLNLAIKEHRSVGDVAPGLDAVAKLRLKIVPISFSKDLTDAVVAKLPPDISSRHAMVYQPAESDVRLLHDRKWFVTGEQRETVSLRRIERGDLLAHCTLTRLPPKTEGRQTTLEEFQRDIRFSLGGQLRQFVSSDQWVNGFGHYCYRVVARGEVQEVPIEWHCYLVASETGQRTSLVFTVEGPMVDRLAAADRALVESLQLVPPSDAPRTAKRN